MSSLKMTFSLTSLILIFALAAMPVMAHDNASGDDITTPRPHDHPVEPDDALEAATTAEDITAGRAGIAVAAHGVHPVPTITVKANEDTVKGKEIIVLADDSATTDVNEHEFTVIISFDRPVADKATDTEAEPTPIAVGTNWTILVLDADGVPINKAATIAASTQAALADDNEAVVTVADEGLPGDMGDMHTFRIQLNRTAGVFGLQTTRVDGVDIIITPGGENDESAIAEFTLVREFTVEPPPADTMPPVVTITAPDMANADGTLTFMISFDEALGTGLSALTIDDLTIDGGTAMATDLTGPAADTNDYTLMVTPDSADASVTVTLNSNSVADADGNALLDTSATGNTASATYDITPPTVVITAPAMPDADGNLTFRFDFSEEVDASTITLDRSGSDNVRLGANSDPMVDTTDNTIYTILVEPRDPTVNTTVLLLKGSVMDLNGNGLAADVEATYIVPVTNTPPVFEDPVPTGLTWCEAEMKAAITLPLARDAEGDELTYSLSGDLPANPVTPPDMGLYWVTTDTQTRELRGTAQVSDAGTYTWTVTDEHGASNVTPLTFTIVVTPYEEPMKVTGVMAMKVDATATIGEDMNKVKLTWTDPNPTAYPNTNCIPSVDSYIISRQALNSHNQGRTPNGAAVTMTVSVADATNTAGGLEYTTETLAAGTYEFTITAVNEGGNSEASDEAVWDRTMYHWVIVNNPPGASTNLRANQTEQPAHSVTLDWIPPAQNPDAPVNDAADAMALYGVDTTFGGYEIEVTNQSTAAITTYPTDGSLIAGDQRTYNIAGLPVGEYTARVIASNVVGKGALSNSQDFEIDVHQPGPTDPTNNPPIFAEDASIASIEATVGVRVPGRFLPAATDADGDDIEYTIEPDLPDGLDFDDETLALTGTPTTVTAETAHVYTASDGEDEATLRFFVTVSAATAGPPATSTPTTMLPANGFIVYVRDMANPPHFGTSNPMIAEWAGMPDLHELFSTGGGGSLQLTVSGVNARQVVMSEIMWAVDHGKVGQDSYDGNQWIELRNRTANAIPITSISFATKSGRPALVQGTDLVSNVVGGGNDWIKDGKGQNGNSGAADGSGQVAFKSMFRTRYHNDSAGWNAGEWKTADQVYHPNHYGTPGVAEPKSAVIIGASGVALGTVINEVANHPSSNSNHEWIELRKRDGGELGNFENWVIDIVTGVNSQTRLFKIPKLNDGRYGNILLITKTDPTRDDDHPLRGGYNVEVDPAQQDNEGRDKNIRYYVADEWDTDLPDNGEFVLILRHGSDKTNHEKVEDIAGYHPNLKVDSADFFTNLWPLRGYPAPVSNKNAIVSGAVHRRQHASVVGTGTTHGDKKDDQVALRDVGWTGVGYKRNADADAQNGGTPGYPNNTLLSNETTSGTAAADVPPVIISEIMYATGNRGNMPQWIELQNTSLNRGINMDGWRLTIVNHDTDDGTDDYLGDLNKSYDINGKISPGETFLIVAHSGTNNTNLPPERIKSLSNKRGQVIMSQYGFEIILETRGKDGNNNNRQAVDVAGNLVDLPTGRVRTNYQSYEDPVWMLPAGADDGGNRISIIRVREKNGDYAGGLRDGKIKNAWVRFDESAHLNAPESTYYGNRNDLSNPGYTIGGPLPVSLSKFRPERMKDTGEVVVRWVTESETNNAGFNILRGEALDGEFTKVHYVAGQGTTTERTVYEWADKSAKPNVIYYYQIQDISLDGEVNTLRTTHLRGNVTAVGKATTTWGEIKALQ